MYPYARHQHDGSRLCWAQRSEFIFRRFRVAHPRPSLMEKTSHPVMSAAPSSVSSPTRAAIDAALSAAGALAAVVADFMGTHHAVAVAAPAPSTVPAPFVSAAMPTAPAPDNVPAPFASAATPAASAPSGASAEIPVPAPFTPPGRVVAKDLDKSSSDESDESATALYLSQVAHASASAAQHRAVTDPYQAAHTVTSSTTSTTSTGSPRLRQSLRLSDVQVPLRPVVSARLCSSRLLRVQAQANTRRSRRQECLLSGLSRTGGPLLQARPARPLHLVLRLGGLLFVFQLRLPLPVQVHLVLQLHLPLPGQVRPVRPPRPGPRAGRPH